MHIGYLDVVCFFYDNQQVPVSEYSDAAVDYTLPIELVHGTALVNKCSNKYMEIYNL